MFLSCLNRPAFGLDVGFEVLGFLLIAWIILPTLLNRFVDQDGAFVVVEGAVVFLLDAVEFTAGLMEGGEGVAAESLLEVGFGGEARFFGLAHHPLQRDVGEACAVGVGWVTAADVGVCPSKPDLLDVDAGFGMPDGGFKIASKFVDGEGVSCDSDVAADFGVVEFVFVFQES